MTPPLLRYFWFHSINSLAASCSLQSAVCSLQMSFTELFMRGFRFRSSLKKWSARLSRSCLRPTRLLVTLIKNLWYPGYRLQYIITSNHDHHIFVQQTSKHPSNALFPHCFINIRHLHVIYAALCIVEMVAWQNVFVTQNSRSHAHNEGQKCWDTSVKWPLFHAFCIVDILILFPCLPQPLPPKINVVFWTLKSSSYFRQHWFVGWGDLRHLKGMK